MGYRTSLKTTRMQAVADDIDSGSGAGTLEICTAGYAAVLSTHTLSDPCGTVSGDTLTFSAIAAATAANSGTAAVARFKNSDGTVVADGYTVGTSGANINLSSTTIAAGDTVTVSSGSIQHAA